MGAAAFCTAARCVDEPMAGLARALSDAYGKAGKIGADRGVPLKVNESESEAGRSSVPRQALHRSVGRSIGVQRANRPAAPPFRVQSRHGDRFRGDFGANPPPRVRRGLRGGTQRQFVTGARGVRTSTRLHVCDRDERTARDWTPRERVR